MISTTTTYCHLSSTPLQMTKNCMLMSNFQIREQPDLQTEFNTALYLKSTVLISKWGKLWHIMPNSDTKHYLWVDNSNSNAQDKQRYIKCYLTCVVVLLVLSEKSNFLNLWDNNCWGVLGLLYEIKVWIYSSHRINELIIHSLRKYEISYQSNHNTIKRMYYKREEIVRWFSVCCFYLFYLVWF